MKEQRITVHIDHDGRITADAHGFSGDTCLQDLEELLGGLAEWESVERKPDTDESSVRRGRTARIDSRRNP